MTSAPVPKLQFGHTLDVIVDFRLVHAAFGRGGGSNDLLIGGKKIVGILTELSAELDRVRHVILGIGVDVNQEAPSFRRSCARSPPR